ncbi:hypothetical protein BDV06DRAFT_21773 [Aspergillus oleicola]
MRPGRAQCLIRWIPKLWTATLRALGLGGFVRSQMVCSYQSPFLGDPPSGMRAFAMETLQPRPPLVSSYLLLPPNFSAITAYCFVRGRCESSINWIGTQPRSRVDRSRTICQVSTRMR